jgi:hypothetical protein
MMKLFDRFKPGQPTTAVPTKWFNDLASWFNFLRGEGVGCEVTITKPDNPSEAVPPVIRVKVTGGGGAEMSDETPQFDGDAGLEGSPGVSGMAARGDHIHPANVPFSPGFVVVPPNTTLAAQGSIGGSMIYARADHAHALDQSVVDAINTAISDGNQSVIDQVNELLTGISGYPAWGTPPGGWLDLTTAGEGSQAADARTWSAAGTTGMDLYVTTRIRYSESDASPQLVAYNRILRFDQYGRIRAISSEGGYTVFVPVGLTI